MNPEVQRRHLCCYSFCVLPVMSQHGKMCIYAHTCATHVQSRVYVYMHTCTDIWELAVQLGCTEEKASGAYYQAAIVLWSEALNS